MPTTTTTRHDVVVVGARAAGAATAMLLARAGLDVLVVDRSRFGADTLSTHALMRGGVLQLHRWGVLDDVIAAGTPAVRRVTFTYADEVLPITIKPAYGVDALYAPRRTVLDPLLAEAATAAGAELRYRSTVTGVSRDSAGRVDGIHAVDAEGEHVRHLARWVIGADGVSSRIARAVGAVDEHRAAATTAVVYGYWSGLDVDGYEWIFRPDACAGAIPTNAGQTCVFASASPGRIGRGGIDVLHEVVTTASPHLAERLAAGVAPTGVRTFPGRPGHLRRAWGPGWALVGDAGSWKDPISAHGLTDVLRDAELLAGAIIAAASGHQTEGDALRQFQHIRDRLSLPLFEVVEKIAAMRWTDAEIPGLLLDLNAAMADEVDTIARLPEQPHPLTIGGGR